MRVRLLHHKEGGPRSCKANIQNVPLGEGSPPICWHRQPFSPTVETIPAYWIEVRARLAGPGEQNRPEAFVDQCGVGVIGTEACPRELGREIPAPRCRVVLAACVAIEIAEKIEV